MCRHFPFVDFVCKISVADQLKLMLEWAWATERLGGKPPWGHLGRLV